MESSMYDLEMELSNEWQLFGGQLPVLPLTNATDAQGRVLQTSWHDDESVEELSNHSLEPYCLEDSPWHSQVDVADFKHQSSWTVEESRPLYGEFLEDHLASSPEDAFLAVDDDNAVVGDGSTMDSNGLVLVAPSYGGSPHQYSSKFEYENTFSYPKNLFYAVPHQSLAANGEDCFAISQDLADADNTFKTDSFVSPGNIAIDSYHQYNHYKHTSEDFDSVDCYDSLLDAESVCKILNQLVADPAGPYASKSTLSAVSPEEVESILCSDSGVQDAPDYNSLPSPEVSFSSSQDKSSSFQEMSSSSQEMSSYSPEPFKYNVQLLPVSDTTVPLATVFGSEYLQADPSLTAKSFESRSSTPCLPYSVEARPDRKLKKKEQNKTAALRYRNKKREEKGVVYTEVEELEHKNAKLQARADDLTKEINYLKSLLDEIKRQ